MARYPWLVSCAALLAGAAQGPVLEITHPPGLDFTLRNSPTEQKYVIETMAGGVALLDYNNDGLLDIFFVNGGRLPQGFARDNPAYWNRLFRQNRGGSFTDVTTAAGLSRAGNNYGMGVAVGDFNNDGRPDLYITNFGRNQLYRNNADGSFTDVTEQAGVAAGGWSVSAAFLDYDNDGRLDLFVSRYLDYDLSRNVLCGTPFHAYCRPDKYKGTANVLFHNEGNGRFRDVSQSSGIGLHIGNGMGAAVNDYDHDGYPDIFVSNDMMEQFLFRNKKDGAFEESAVTAGVAYSVEGGTFSGMGAAFADYDNDGLPDIAVSNLAREKHALFHNDGGGRFSDASLRSGLAELSARSSGWGLGFHDFDNDGWKDLFVSQSHVLDNVERIDANIRYLEPPALYLNRGGRFEKADLGPLPAVAGRGVAFGDLNNDGAIDAIITVLGGHPLVFRNRPGGNHWLIVQLVGTRSNRDGIGARVRAGKQWAYVSTSGSYLSSSDVRVHFGLGAAMRTDIEILWPSGKRQTLGQVSADRVLTVKEPE